MKDEVKLLETSNWETAQNKSAISARIMQPRSTGAGEAFTHAHIHTHPDTHRKSKNLFWPPYTIILSIPDLKALRAVDYILCVYIYMYIYYTYVFSKNI